VTIPEILIFDLFGTLVFFDDSRVPTIDVGGARFPATITGLPQILEAVVTDVTVESFFTELRRVGQEVTHEKRRLGIELHSSVRFERTLRALGAPPASAAIAARRMATLHMDTLARSVVCPAGRADLLRTLAARHRLGLLSNFDCGVTARRVIAEAGLTPFLETIVISEEEGLRKPSRELFERACARMSAAPGECIYIGDTHVEDIQGSHAAGLLPVWIRRDRDAALTVAPAAAILDDVDALPRWLSSRRAAVSGQDAERT